MREHWPLNKAGGSGEIAVIGLARSGRAVAMLLARGGSQVYASDAGRTPELEATAAELEREGVGAQVGAHDLDRIGRAALVVVSPGVSPDAPAIAVARQKKIDVVSEIDIALRFLPGLRYIAVTGTNGKTTTTALVAHLLQSLRFRAPAAGNIGTALSEIALQPEIPQWVALEVSSYQLHDTPGIRPTVGIVTNLSPNHLDRYRSVEDYYADKKLLFRNATAASHWVTNADDADVQALAAGVPGVHARFSTAGRADAYFNRTTEQLMVLGSPLIRRAELKLLGDHNVANALCAALAVMLADAANRTTDACMHLAEGLRSFRSLEHRNEVVGETSGVLWINDSKSTNVASTLVALRGMSRPTILLLGGRHKGEPYKELASEIERTVKLVIAYGEASPLIVRDLTGVVPVEEGGSSFPDVVARARQAAAPGDAILLSPACSSFDMFANYEHRGAEFKRLAGASMASSA
ncbi:MAG TPA: UDP-N-acetylmuramoyl-L-alanine--D-glutamate ligase [Gemmatimonadaceae bacterium]|nr:UDP-N-acetylmuramoyl-L-alanine--D-glutamate ligase [Gemmatimonadaceae bacterium]